MDFESFKYNTPDILLDMIEFVYNGGFFLSFKLEMEAFCQFIDFNNQFSIPWKKSI